MVGFTGQMAHRRSFSFMRSLLSCGLGIFSFLFIRILFFLWSFLFFCPLHTLQSIRAPIPAAPCHSFSFLFSYLGGYCWTTWIYMDWLASKVNAEGETGSRPLENNLGIPDCYQVCPTTRFIGSFPSGHFASVSAVQGFQVWVILHHSEAAEAAEAAADGIPFGGWAWDERHRGTYGWARGRRYLLFLIATLGSADPSFTICIVPLTAAVSFFLVRCTVGSLYIVHRF
ncbi:hypothetical protein SODALDRAFT_2413 [Sodiomyces alkalinus F11]|uniref:Uncharacterized protein n=1 Tax=Sodiomyces alkalinus (strain CBS 110278 / VKM F-3762 / F11) TaxID=1314773 RepID=A0A3N2Q544_SODAK|nr:hypothetical protein SODALDRAFT_2413 [Sodiomyces alkalinus F11]ROT41882.1 hypothetical protein SODALDRAFT_2413 [Sodiomyces alkalinus F11]